MLKSDYCFNNVVVDNKTKEGNRARASVKVIYKASIRRGPTFYASHRQKLPDLKMESFPYSVVEAKKIPSLTILAVIHHFSGKKMESLGNAFSNSKITALAGVPQRVFHPGCYHRSGGPSASFPGLFSKKYLGKVISL